MTEELGEIAARINTNPLGRLMHGQRELFHSNLVGWFFEVLPDAADAVFRSYAPEGVDRGRFPEREPKNMDLVFHWPDRAPVVIENKVFSLPGKKQLDAYEATTRTWPDAPGLVLLSVSAPGFDAGNWQHLRYGDLATRIRAALPETETQTYEVETMRHYADLIEDLQRLIDTVDVRSDSETVWQNSTVNEVIGSSQMRAALHKARAQRVARAINDAIPTLEQPSGSGMTRAKPLVEAFEYVRIDGVDLHIGWQLQGDDFRRTAIYHDAPYKGDSDASRHQREEFSRQHPQFFTFPSPLAQKHHGRGEFNHFAPESVLKYVRVPGMTIAELKAAAAAVHAEIVAMRPSGGAGAKPATATRAAP